MTKKESIKKQNKWKALIKEDKDFFKGIIQETLQEILEKEMEEAIGAGKGERTGSRLSYRSGYYTRSLVTRVGKIELMVPQDRNGIFNTEIFERYQRSEKAYVSALMEMYVQGVSTRKVKKITEELCGHSFSAGTISNINKNLDSKLNKFANRKLEEAYPYLILDARYEKVREDGVIRSQAVLSAIGVNWEGRRRIIGVELANRESNTSWKDFLIRLKERGLKGVEFVVSDNHKGLKTAIGAILPEACWQRCYVHFLRNAIGYLPRKKIIDDVLVELRWIYDRRNLKEAKVDLAAWLTKWGDKYKALCEWAEENIEETLTFYRLPIQHHKNLKSTNVLERLHEEIKRRTYVVRIFPNKESCIRLVRALAVEIDEYWVEGTRYLNMDFYKEQKKTRLKKEKIAA